MAMTGPEIVEFSEAVRRAYTSTELSTLLQKLDREFTDYVTEKIPYPDQVIELVGSANSRGWISEFVPAILANRPNNKFIKDFLANHTNWDPAKDPPLKHPSDTLRVFGGKSFIARDELRDALKKMDDPTERKVLLVTSGGHRKVGKTYSRDLIDWVCRKRPPSVLAYIDLDTDKYDPIKLARKLAKEMRLPAGVIPEEATEQAARSNQDLVSSLTTIGANPAPIVWIVLDGFREQLPTEPIQDFIVQLAEKIESMQEFRLVLLNYTVRLPLNVGGFIFKEDLKPLTRTELETHFSLVHKRKHKTDPSLAELSDYLTCMDERFAFYSQQEPQSVGNQLLINLAVSDVVKIIEGP